MELVWCQKEMKLGMESRIMDSMVKINEKDMKTWFVHLKYVVRFEQLHMFEAILC